MDIDKFRDMFGNDEIYLRRIDLFIKDDPEEAMQSEALLPAQMGLRKFVLEDELQVNTQRAFNRQYSEVSYINCWHLFESETLHMWENYGHGVAVFSTYERLKAAVNKWQSRCF